MLGILSIGQTLIILSGGIDMSLGAIYWICVMAGAQLTPHANYILVLIACLGLGAVIGMLNGMGISLLKIPPVVMTLGTMIMLTGVLFVVYGGGGKGKAAQELIQFSTSRIGIIPTITLIWIILILLFHFILNKTTFGWQLRALGSSEIASIRSGIRANAVKIKAYVTAGVLAAISGLFYLGWARTPYPTFQSGAGVGAELALNSIAAVIIGGTLFTGGKGGVLNTFLGVLVLSLISSILSMIGLGHEWQMIASGMIILLIVGLYSKVRRESS